MNAKVIRKLNELEKKSRDSLCEFFIELSINHEEILDKDINDYIVKFNETINTDNPCMIDIDDYCEKLTNTYTETVGAFLDKMFGELYGGAQQILLTTNPDHASYNLLKTRIKLIVIRNRKLLVNYVNSLVDVAQDYLLYLNDYYKEVTESLDEEVIEQSSTDLIEDRVTNESTFKKIFDYKEMEQLAVSAGYVYKGSNGSHRVYENSKTNICIVIPSHTLGVGLSYRIQKQIMKGCC